MGKRWSVPHTKQKSVPLDQNDVPDLPRTVLIKP